VVTTVGHPPRERHARDDQQSQIAIDRAAADAESAGQIVHTIAGVLEEPQALNHADDSTLGALRLGGGHGRSLSTRVPLLSRGAVGGQTFWLSV